VRGLLRRTLLLLLLLTSLFGIFGVVLSFFFLLFTLQRGFAICTPRFV
jgi:hypothetical protein